MSGMQKNNMETNELNQALAPYFALPEGETARDALLKILTTEIQHLIDYDLNKLWSLLYRIDVAEKKVKEVIATTPFTEHAKHIAELIIARQLEKIESKRKYKN